MGRLRTLTVFLTLSAWGATTNGAPPPYQEPPATAQTQPEAVDRPAPPASPSKYVEAGVYLFDEKGDHALAAQYFQAADDYRDMLTAQEQATVDAYRAKLAASIQQPAPAAAPLVQDPAGQAPPVEPMIAEQPVSALAPVSAPVTASPGTGEDPRSTPMMGDKQSGRWLLRQARELMALARYDEAAAKIAEARALNVRWGLFDDTPDRAAKDLEKVRPQGAAAAATTTMDRQQAKDRLKSARQALAAGQVDHAEALAREVAGANIRFGLLEDNPDKVLAAVQAVRGREVTRRQESAGGGGLLDLYTAAVQEARAALAAGQLDVAEEKARKAQGLNVVPPATADRAESVLNDVAMIRGAGGQMASEPRSAAVEREANALLAQGDQQGAAARFVEAERLRAEERATAPAPTDPTVQPAQASPVLTLTPASAGQSPALETPMPAAGADAMVTAATADAAQDPAAGAAMPAPSLEVTPSPDAPLNHGEGLLIQARAFLSAGNYAAARQAAEQAKAGGFGVEAQADEVLSQIALSSQGSSLNLYEAALDALRKGDNARAKALLNEVAASDLQDEAFLQKVQDLLARIPGEQAGEANLQAIDDAESVKAQKLNVEVGTKVAEARRLLETNPDEAIKLLEETLVAVKNAEINATASRTMLRRVEVAIELARKEKLTFDQKMQDKNYRAEIEAKRLRILEADKAKKSQIDELMKSATEAEAQGDYAQAEQKARMAAEIDPNNVAAVAMATKARWQRRYEHDVDIKRDLDETAVAAFQGVSEAGIVPEDLDKRGISFPKTFADLSQSRRELLERLAPKKDQKVLDTEAKLGEPVTLNMEQEQSLQTVVDFLASYSGLNFALDPGALAQEGLTPNTAVSPLKVKDVSLKTALKLLLNPLNLSWQINENVVLITSPLATRSQTFPTAYPVADLIISPHGRKRQNPVPGLNGMNPVDQMNPAQPSLNVPMFQNENQGMLPAAGTPLAGGSGGPTAMTSQPEVTREDFDPLIQLIKASIAPGTWQESPEDFTMGGFGLGGGAEGDLGIGTEQAVGSITPFYLNISLIIRHTSEVHDEIVDLLRQLRRLQDLQISVEVRFVTLSDSFFEEIGVDFDFAIQSDTVGPKSSFAIPNPDATFYDPIGGGGGAGAAAAAPYLLNPARDHAIGRGDEPMVIGTNGPTNSILNPQFQPNLAIPFIQDSFSAITPFNGLTSVNTGLSMGLSFLSDLEVYFFLRAVQGDTRSNLVQAPKVTTFNGAPASVFSTRQTNYVASITPVVGAGAVAFQPQPASFQDGVQLFVTPVVSADRRYVRMTLAPIFQTLEGFDTFTIPAAVGGGGLGGGATSINGQIQLPRFVLNQVSTTVTVPDGGTVLLGGVKTLRESRTEFGVPILSKTPLINRLFRNIGIGRQTDSLMIMVTPRIIILEEEEERLGIPAIQNVTF